MSLAICLLSSPCITHLLRHSSIRSQTSQKTARGAFSVVSEGDVLEMKLGQLLCEHLQAAFNVVVPQLPVLEVLLETDGGR